MTQVQRTIYLDHAATTPVDPRVVEAMQPYWSETFGNTSSIHGAGRAALKGLEQARQTVADVLGCHPMEIVFTGCGTESDNLALRGVAWAARKGGRGNHVIATPIEHHAVGVTAEQLHELHEFDVTLVEVDEYGCRFAVDVRRGHKTGFYLDQRDNRALAAEYAAGREALNAFAYTGAFGVWALKGGAVSVVNLESSAAALDLARRNVELNGLDASKIENVVGDVFQVLRQYRDSRRQFDLIILDPPKFAESRGQVERATRGYKDINWLALRLLRPGGVLFAFSCSGLIPPGLFQKIVAGAALDAGREAQIVQRLTQAPDHPVALNFPEGEYLKGLICRV